MANVTTTVTNYRQNAPGLHFLLQLPQVLPDGVLNFKVEFPVPDQPVHAVRGVDLGVKRLVATVLLHPNRPLRARDLTMLRDGEKRERLNYLNRRDPFF